METLSKLQIKNFSLVMATWAKNQSPKIQVVVGETVLVLVLVWQKGKTKTKIK